MSKPKQAAIAVKMWLQRLFWRLKFTFFREEIPKNSDGRVYLNLGCGVNTSSEFINIDAFPFRRTHLVLNIQDLSVVPTNSVDMVYASHVIEHIPRAKLEKTLTEWRRVLKPGGILRFGVPDFDKLLAIYTAGGRNVENIVNQVLGQDRDYDRHCTLWNLDYAKKVLRISGFTGEPRFWDAKTADHHGFHDKTNRDNSLNLEVVK